MAMPYIPGVPTEMIDLVNKEMDQEFEDAFQAICAEIDAELAKDPNALEGPDPEDDNGIDNE